MAASVLRAPLPFLRSMGARMGVVPWERTSHRHAHTPIRHHRAALRLHLYEANHCRPIRSVRSSFQRREICRNRDEYP